MNIVLAVGLLTGLYMVKYQKVSEADLKPIVGHVHAGFAGSEGRHPGGDRIVRLDDKVNPTWEDIDLKEVASAYRAHACHGGARAASASKRL